MCTYNIVTGHAVGGLLTFFASMVFFCTCVPAQVRAQGPGERQLIFNDDFDRERLGNFWAVNEGWTIRDGQAFNGVDDNGRLLTTARVFDENSYLLETEITGLVTGYQRAYYLLFGHRDDSGEPGYLVRYDPLGAGTLLLGEATDNYFFPEVLDRKIGKLDPALTYKIRIAKYENGLIQVYLGDETGFPDVPTLEAIDTTHPTLGRVSWLTTTQTAGEEFFVEYVRAEVPEIQKTIPEKPVGDDLIEEIVVNSENAYEISRLTAGETFFTDRPYTLTDVPDFLENARFVKTANDDKRLTSPDLLTAYITRQSIAYVAFDPRATVLPTWLSKWTKIDEVIGTNDPGSDYFELYTLPVAATVFSPTRYLLRLGGALAAPAVGTNMNYLLVVVPIDTDMRYEAEAAFLSGARTATNQLGFSGDGFVDYINAGGDYTEWTVDVPATSLYSLSVRFSNGSDAARELAVSVDGEAVNTASFFTTGLWTNWATRNLGGTVLLATGKHRIRLTATGTSGPNVDYLEITPSAARTSARMDVVPTAASSLSTGDIQVSVYPNPAVSAVNFLLANNEVGTAELRIIDMRGREVHRQVITDRSRVEVSDWPAGTYIYQLASGDELTYGKFVRAN